MSVLAEFFKGSDTRFGIFYPKDYLLAVFPNFEQAQKAERLLRNSGIPEDAVLAVPGEEVIRLAQEERREGGFWALMMQELSRIFETEEPYLDRDLALAREGAAFLAVYSPTEEDKNRVWQRLEPMEPLVARHYGFVGMEHLTGES
jgi:hypothetical protein